MSVTHQPIPADFPVQPLKKGQDAKNPRDKKTCGHCGLSWDDGQPTLWTPAPSARCPFEYYHVYLPENETEDRELVDVMFAYLAKRGLKEFMQRVEQVVIRHDTPENESDYLDDVRIALDDLTA